jgi:hypothetical protein
LPIQTPSRFAQSMYLSKSRRSNRSLLSILTHGISTAALCRSAWHVRPRYLAASSTSISRGEVAAMGSNFSATASAIASIMASPALRLSPRRREPENVIVGLRSSDVAIASLICVYLLQLEASLHQNVSPSQVPALHYRFLFSHWGNCPVQRSTNVDAYTYGIYEALSELTNDRRKTPKRCP